jgi:2-polyprenyl-6-methoxyphenol hydroxylase-like FAD-dependent oxidoreductase
MGPRPRVVIIGGGMGGLATALALEKSGHDVLILERDAPPPEIDASSAFDEWNRPGVPQLRHTHIFLARLQTILRDRHPELLAELQHVGIERSSIDEILPPGVADGYVPQKSDDDLLHLWGRRATLEYVLRRHVGRLGHVRFQHETRVEGLVIEKEGAHLRVRGVEVRRAGECETIPADIVVDASGVRSKITDLLRAAGAQIREERHESPCAYYSRHFVQRDGTDELPRQGTGAHVDYLVFGTFFAEGRTFSIAFAVPEIEPELSLALKRPEGFDEACRRIPVLDRLTSNAEPISRVLGGAGLANRWTHYGRASGPHVLGFFPVGDSYIVTNPIYGRGCSMAFVEAHALADAISGTDEPLARAKRYHGTVHRLLRPHFDFSVAADKGFLARAKMARGDAVSFFDRFVSKVYESVLAPALEEKPVVSREWLKAQQMREVTPPWVAIFFVFYVLLLWALRAMRGVERLTRPVAPSREEMLHAVLAAQATGHRLQATGSESAPASDPALAPASDPAPAPASDPAPAISSSPSPTPSSSPSSLPPSSSSSSDPPPLHPAAAAPVPRAPRVPHIPEQ